MLSHFQACGRLQSKIDLISFNFISLLYIPFKCFFFFPLFLVLLQTINKGEMLSNKPKYFSCLAQSDQLNIKYHPMLWNEKSYLIRRHWQNNLLTTIISLPSCLLCRDYLIKREQPCQTSRLFLLAMKNKEEEANKRPCGNGDGQVKLESLQPVK